MNDDPASLQNLHDMVLPPAVPLWPPAPGWYWVVGALLLALAWLMGQAICRYRANAYRRAALTELARLRDDNLTALPALLKRTALAAFPRSRVAGLSGPAWWQFLDDSAGTTGFSDGAGLLLDRLAYDPGGTLDPDERERLLAATQRWLSQHRSSDEPTPC